MQIFGPQLLLAIDGLSISLVDLLQSTSKYLGHICVKLAPNEVKEVNGKKSFTFSLFIKFSLCFKVLRQFFRHFTLETDNTFATCAVTGDGLTLMMQN